MFAFCYCKGACIRVMLSSINKPINALLFTEENIKTETRLFSWKCSLIVSSGLRNGNEIITILVYQSHFSPVISSEHFTQLIRYAVHQHFHHSSLHYFMPRFSYVQLLHTQEFFHQLGFHVNYVENDLLLKEKLNMKCHTDEKPHMCELST